VVFGQLLPLLRVRSSEPPTDRGGALEIVVLLAELKITAPRLSSLNRELEVGLLGPDENLR